MILCCSWCKTRVNIGLLLKHQSNKVSLQSSPTRNSSKHSNHPAFKRSLATNSIWSPVVSPLSLFSCNLCPSHISIEPDLHAPNSQLKLERTSPISPNQSCPDDSRTIVLEISFWQPSRHVKKSKLSECTPPMHVYHKFIKVHPALAFNRAAMKKKICHQWFSCTYSSINVHPVDWHAPDT